MGRGGGASGSDSWLGRGRRCRQAHVGVGTAAISAAGLVSVATSSHGGAAAQPSIAAFAVCHGSAASGGAARKAQPESRCSQGVRRRSASSAWAGPPPRASAAAVATALAAVASALPRRRGGRAVRSAAICAAKAPGAGDKNPFAEAELRAGAGAREAAAERGSADAWAEASSSLAEACGVGQDWADAWLAKAFGWSLWLGAGKPAYLANRAVVPCPQQLREDIRWLSEGPLSLASSTDLRHVVETAPRAALRKAAERYRRSLASAPDGLREDFHNVVLRDPKVLELEWDCEGSCSARCAVCWRVRKVA